MKRRVVLAFASALMLACGQDTEEQRAAEHAARAREEAAKTAEQAAQEAGTGIEQMARGLEASGSAGGGKAVEPVGFRELINLLPELDGWQRTRPTGERMTAPVSFSQAEADYRRGDSSIEVKVIDSGFNQLLLTPYSMFLAAGYERESSEGHEKSTKVNGHPGWEKWNSESRGGEVNALVGKRFLVTISGYQLEGVQQLHEIAGKMDFDRLSTLQ